MKKHLKYLTTDIVFQEVPNEVSLAIDITGCPHKCEGCHSNMLWKDVGDILINDLDNLIAPYSNLITCVCFMGGDQNMTELISLCRKVQIKYNLKTCVYSGGNDVSIFKECITYLDYLKIGSYVKKLGGLDSSTTNQKFYKIENGYELTDITNYFQIKK